MTTLAVFSMVTQSVNAMYTRYLQVQMPCSTAIAILCIVIKVHICNV